MPGKRKKLEIHAQLKILSDEGYSGRPIFERLELTQKTVSRSIHNFRFTGNLAARSHKVGQPPESSV